MGSNVGPGFVTVDTRLHTSNSRIWAAGDLTEHPQFTHVAVVQDCLAAPANRRLLTALVTLRRAWTRR